MTIDLDSLTPPPVSGNIIEFQRWANDFYNAVASVFAQVDEQLQQALEGIPVGMPCDWSTETLPAGNWLWCDGSAISRATYETLFNVIGTDWGVGDGSTTFNLPDFRDRVAVYKGNMGGIDAGLISDESEGAGNTLTVGNSGGEDNHELTMAELPADGVQIEWSDAAGVVIERAPSIPAGGDNKYYFTELYQASFTLNGHVMQTADLGSGTAHNNMPPYVVAAKIIRYA